MKRILRASLLCAPPWIRDLARLWYHRLRPGSLRKNISGQGNQVVCGDAILYAVEIQIHGNNNVIVIEPDCYLKNVTMLVFGNNHSIYLSSGCRFHGGGNIVLDEHDASLIIGRGTTIEDAYIHVIEAHAKVVIGRNCMFSYGIEIRTGDGHGIFDTTKQRLNPPRNVTIGDRVWIGSRAIILKGVEIAEDSVVGSGAVVTKSFAESGVVLAGNPAKVIRRGVRWFYDRSGRF